MPTLLDVQRAVGRGLLADDVDAATLDLVADGFAAARLAIHRQNVVGNLGKALGLAFPAVDRLVGAEFFADAARWFAVERPPRTACLDDYGAEFPDFLAEWVPAASLPYLADVARLEWAVDMALHAPDDATLDIAALRDAAADAGRLRFAAHPAVSLVRSDYPVNSIWRAVLDGDDVALAAIDLGSGPVQLIVERRAGSVDIARLDEPEWRFAAALFDGATLQSALESAGDGDAEAWLAEHLARGRLVGARLAASPEAPA